MNGVYHIPLSTAIAADEPRFGRGPTRAEGPQSTPPQSTPPRSTVQREFIAGAENRVAVAAFERLLAVLSGLELDAPFEVLYNPLVLHGMPGSGKSHLARGLAAQWLRSRPAETVTCLTAAEFAGQFVEAIETRTVDAWRAAFRRPGLFVLEDLGQLVTRPAAQAELAHTLDALADCGAMVVVTSRVATCELAGLSPRLRSRLTAGLSLSLALPGAAARAAIVEQLAGARGLKLEKSAARLLAGALAYGAPELAGALAQLEQAAASTLRGSASKAFANGDGNPDAVRDRPSFGNSVTLDEALVRRYLAERETPRRASLKCISAHTARYFALRVADLKSPSRKRAIVVARDMAMYLARQLTGNSLKQIGDYFGGRDHTTVLHGCRKTEELILHDTGTQHAFGELRQGLAMA